MLTPDLKKTLVLFDFDGTLTSRDSLADFIRHVHGQTGFLLGLLALSPWLLLWKARLLSRHKAKEKLLAHYFGGMPAGLFREKAQDYAERHLPQTLRENALKELEKHRQQGAEIAIVTASAEDWIAPWAAGLGIRVIASVPEVKDGRITGRLLPANCYGPEKARRIREVYRPEDYGRIIAYGDSCGDREMLEMAHERHYRVF